MARAVRGRFAQTRDLWKRASMRERVERVSSHAVSRWLRSPACCGFSGVFSVGRDFLGYFFLIRTHTACCKYEAALPHVHLYYLRVLP